MAGLCFVVRRIPRRWQNVVFAVTAACCSLGIFFRYAMGMTFGGEIDIKTLLIQTLQVCNFNFVLLPLMLIPKLEIARQYSAMFSMLAAFTTFLSIPSRYAAAPWYDTAFLNFWLNHFFAILLPVLMIAAGVLKPKREYVLPVTGCVAGYFLISYLSQLALISAELLTRESSMSYVMKTDKNPVFELLYSLIPIDCFYLLPLLPILAGIFYGMAKLFEKDK